MKRDKMIDKLISQSLKILKDDKSYSKCDELKIWEECSDWNSEHSNDEIFMCEYSGHYSTTQVIGYMIEDDIFIYPEYKEAYEHGTV